MARVALVAHDAGGAEVISSWARRQAGEYLLAAAGPAMGIFARKCPDLIPVPLDQAIEAADWVLCGSVWQSGFERNAIRTGRRAGKKTVTFLDHWVNYRPRFEEDGELTLPDEIWVGDEDARRIARADLPEVRVVLQPNPYVLDLKDELAAMPSRHGVGSILYVCEPVADHAAKAHGDPRYFGYTEFDAMDYFFENLGVFGDPGRPIVVRPHPAEAFDKYDAHLPPGSVRVTRGGQRSLLAEVAAADIVVGCESMAMVVGLTAGKRVVSAIPPGGRACQLPQADIEHLSDLAAGSRE